jgi:hypothetical protein
MPNLVSGCLRKRALRACVALAACMALWSAAGCVTPPMSAMLPGFGPAEPVPCRLVSYWDRDVYQVIDSKHGGLGDPAIKGRVLFYGPEEFKKPIAAKGTLVVDWYNANTPPNAPLELLGHVVYNSSDLPKFLHTDMIGLGYTVPVPWPSYDPKYTRIRMHVYLVPDKAGDPLFAEPVIVTLNANEPMTSAQISVPVTLPPGVAAPSRVPFTPQATGPGTSNWDWAGRQPNAPIPLGGAALR